VRFLDIKARAERGEVDLPNVIGYLKDKVKQSKSLLKEPVVPTVYGVADDVLALAREAKETKRLAEREAAIEAERAKQARELAEARER
jgi:hypothetical protein